MEGWRLLTCGAVFVATFGILYLENSSQQNVGSASPRHLVIGVLSARDHFLQRDAIRHTWGSQVSNLPNTELIFIVGEHDCRIPPNDRLSPHSCEKWNIQVVDTENSNSRLFVTRGPAEEKRDKVDFACYTGFGFQILHPLVLESFSVSIELLSRVGNATVILQDGEEILESIEVSRMSCSEESSTLGYCEVKLSHRLLLPRHFEGEIRLLNFDISEAELCGNDAFTFKPTNSWQCSWTNSSVISYKYLRSERHHLTKWNAKACTLLSAAYSLSEKHMLKEHIEKEPARIREWKDHFDFVLRKIAIEQVVNGDLMVLPHLDIYSRLPQKVMSFMKSSTLEYDFNYLMKVDDDTIVNVSSLKKFIQSEAYHDPKIWSRFHYHRSVPYYGKWADIQYPSLTYPSFPAGAGYLMSKSLVKSLVTAGPHMATYGGEDVSMGIWISAAVKDAKLVDVPCWLPHPECEETVLIPQLSPIDMMEIWKGFS